MEYLREAEAASGGSIRMVVREKGEGANSGAYATLLDAIRSGGNTKVAGFPGDEAKEVGAMADEWRSQIVSADFEVTDAAKGVEAYLGAKDEDAIKQISKAGHLAARIARDGFVPAMEDLFNDDNASGKTNAQLASEVETAAMGALESKYKVSPADSADVDFALPPFVQSGGGASIAIAAPGQVSSASRLSDDVLIFSATLKFKQCCALVGRTFFIDASPAQLSVYEALLEAEVTLIDKLRPGAVIGAVVSSVQDQLMKHPGMPMDARLGKNFGCGIGVRVGDEALALTAKNNTVIAAGMAFGVVVALREIPLTDAPASAAKT